MKKVLLLLTTLGLLLATTPTADAFWSPAQINTSYVTAYNLTGIMADGLPTHYGAVACKRSLRLGTSIHIEGLGDFVCEDRFGDENLAAMFDISLPGASLYQCDTVTGVYDWWLN